MQARANIVSLPFSTQVNKVYFEVEQVVVNELSNQNLAVYNQTFNQSILQNPKDYYMAITKFSIPLAAVPFWIPDMIDGFTQNNQQTIYSVTISYYNGTAWVPYTAPVMYVPENGYPFTSVLNNQYWFVNNIDWALQLINNAFITAIGKIAGTPYTSAVAPYLTYNPTTNLITLNLPPDDDTNYYAWNTYNTPTAEEGYMQVYLNYPLSVLLQNIQGWTAPTGMIPSNPTGEDYLIWPSTITSPYYNTTSNSFALTQQYYSLNQWSPLASIQIISGSLPVARENVLNTQNQGLASVPVLQSFYPIYVVGDPKPSEIIYVAAAYHLIDCFGDLDINQLKLQYQWVSQIGQVFPIIIPYNYTALTEIAFVKKTTFTG